MARDPSGVVKRKFGWRFKRTTRWSNGAHPVSALKRRTKPMTIAPIDIRLYLRPLGVSLPESPMPQSSALIPQPPCFLCNRPHHHTPYAVGYLTAGWPVLEEKIFIICFDCADSDDALKEKIIAKVSASRADQTEEKTPAPALATWTTQAARDWVRLATTHQEQTEPAV
jgi:hypothetical protein